jgi:hypothetical protein
VNQGGPEQRNEAWLFHAAVSSVGAVTEGNRSSHAESHDLSTAFYGRKVKARPKGQIPVAACCSTWKALPRRFSVPADVQVPGFTA